MMTQYTQMTVSYLCLIFTSPFTFIYLEFLTLLSTLYRLYHDGLFLWAEKQVGSVRYCELLTMGKQLPTFPYRVWGLNR